MSNGYNQVTYQNGSNKINQTQLNQLNQMTSNQQQSINSTNCNHQQLPTPIIQQQQQQQSPSFNQSTNKTKYHQKALNQIRISLQPFINNERPNSSASTASEASSNFTTNNLKQSGALFEMAKNTISNNPNYLINSSINSNSSLSSKYMIDNGGQLMNGQLIVENSHPFKNNYSSTDKQISSSSPLIVDYSSSIHGQPMSGHKLSYHHHNQLNGNCNKLISSTSSISTPNHHFNPQLNNYLNNNKSMKSPNEPIASPTTINDQFNCNTNGYLSMMNNSSMIDQQQQQPISNLQTAKLQAWSVRQTKSQSPVIMQSVKSTQVQKPILQTACAPILQTAPIVINNQQQQQQPLISNSTTAIVYPQQLSPISSNAQTNQTSNQFLQQQIDEKNLKLELVQLNANIAKKFLNKISSETDETPIKSSNYPPLNKIAFQKQQMPLPEPPKSKNLHSNSPVYSVYSVINDKNANNQSITNQLNNIDQFVRTSSAQSNCSNSSKLTSYSTTSSTNASFVNKNPPLPPYGKQFNQLINNFNGTNNQQQSTNTVHAKPITVQINNSNNGINNGTGINNNQTIVMDDCTSNQNVNLRPPSYESILFNSNHLSTNLSSPSPSNFIELLNSNNSPSTLVNNNHQSSPQPIDPPSYASVAILMMNQKQQNQLSNKPPIQPPNQKISRPLPPLPNDLNTTSGSSCNTSRNTTPIQYGPPLPPKPTKLIHTQMNHFNNFNNDELISMDRSTFNATSNLQLLQKQLEQHLQEQKPLVEKLKQIQLQKHQQKVQQKLNLKANTCLNVNSQQLLINSNQPNNLLPPVLPAKNNAHPSTTLSSVVTKNATTISSLKRPVPAPPLLPKKESSKNKLKPIETPLNTVPSLPSINMTSKQLNEQSKSTKKQNEYENTSNDDKTDDLIQTNGQNDDVDNEIEQQLENDKKTTHHSPIPQRKFISKEREQERRESKVKIFSAAAYKFFMEQHIENVIKSHKQREKRKNQLENEMLKANLTDEAQSQMRKMLQKKESNYIRLKRARMEKSMFEPVAKLGEGGFGEFFFICSRIIMITY